MARTNDAGATVGRSLANLLADAVTKARVAVMPAEQVEKYRYLTAWLEDLEREMAPTMQRMYGELLARDDLPDSLRAPLELAAHPQHQWDVLTQLVAVVGGAFSALGQLGQVEYRELVQRLNIDKTNVPISPPDLADLVERGRVGQDWAAGEAAKSGVGADNFAVMVNGVGEPPGPIDMLSLWRRGLMTQDQLEAAIKFSRIADEYIPFVLDLAHSFMSPADAIELAVKGVVTPDQGRDLFVTAGGIDAQWDDLYAGAGDAIGVVEVMNLWNQGLVNEATVDAVLGRSRINPIFYDVAKLQRHHFLAPYQIEQALKAGAVSPATATQWMLNLGYSAEQAAAFAAGGTTPSVAKAKTETESTVVGLYEDQALTYDQAEAALQSLGYDAQGAAMLLAYADTKRALSQQTTAVAKVRAAYEAGHISDIQAKGDLDALHIPAQARDAWVEAWAIEKTSQLRTLSVSELGDVAKKGFMTYASFIDRAVAMGYSQVDAELLSAYYGNPQYVDQGGNPIIVGGQA